MVVHQDYALASVDRVDGGVNPGWSAADDKRITVGKDFVEARAIIRVDGSAFAVEAGRLEPIEQVDARGAEHRL
jgi:hypothetical protein